MTDQAATDPDADAPSDARSAPSMSTPWCGRLALALTALAVVGVRLWVTSRAAFPQVVADEPAYLAMGRLLGGGPRWELRDAATYGPAYSFLLAPWFALGWSPDAVYRAAITVNAVLGGATFVVLEALVRRLTTLVRPRSIVVAALAVSLPALLLTGGYAWSDNLSPLVLAVALLAGLRLVDRPTTGRAAALGAATVGACAAHGRFTPLLVLVLGLLVVLTVRRQLAPAWAAAVALGTGSGYLAMLRGSQAIYDQLYASGGVTQTTDDLGRVLQAWPLVVSTSGQLWYLAVSTAGVALLGGLALARASWATARAWWPRSGTSTWSAAGSADHAAAGRRADRRVDLASVGIGLRDPLAVAWVVAVLGLSFAVSAGFVIDAYRPDHLAYGRYNDALAPVLAACGVSLLVATPRWTARLVDAVVAVAATTVAALPMVLTRQELLRQPFNGFTILGLLPVHSAATRDVRGTTVAAVTLVALVLAAGAVPGRRAKPVAVLVVLGLLAGSGAVLAHRRTDPRALADPRTVTTVLDVLRPGDVVAYPRSGGTLGFYRFPFYVPELRIVTADDTPGDDGSELVLARTDTEALAAAGYRLAWVDPDGALGLWVAPGPRQDDLAARRGLLLPSGLRGSPADDGTVTLADRIAVADGRLRATAVVERPTTEPWPAIDHGAPERGRVRLSLAIVGGDCACVVAEPRVDLGAWIPAGRSRLRVPLDVDLAALEPGRYQVTVSLIREGVARFGTPAETTITVPD